MLGMNIDVDYVRASVKISMSTQIEKMLREFDLLDASIRKTPAPKAPMPCDEDLPD